jgi:hypothetical protein
MAVAVPTILGCMVGVVVFVLIDMNTAVSGGRLVLLVSRSMVYVALYNVVALDIVKVVTRPVLLLLLFPSTRHRNPCDHIECLNADKESPLRGDR